jgi:hypothetical protein
MISIGRPRELIIALPRNPDNYSLDLTPTSSDMQIISAIFEGPVITIASGK